MKGASSAGVDQASGPVDARGLSVGCPARCPSSAIAGPRGGSGTNVNAHDVAALGPPAGRGTRPMNTSGRQKWRAHDRIRRLAAYGVALVGVLGLLSAISPPARGRVLDSVGFMLTQGLVMAGAEGVNKIPDIGRYLGRSVR